LVDETVHTGDDVDIGDIDAVSRDFIVVKRGFLKVHYYYIPISKVDGWDGFDPSRFYVKDFPGYTTVYPEVTMITPRFIRPVYTAKDSTPEELRIYRCDLCSGTYRSEDELSNHVASTH
jgi:hypothetical protein